MSILVFSKSGKETLICEGICIGRRQPVRIIGDKLSELMKEKKIDRDELVKKLGSNYSNTIDRVLKNDEIPKPSFVEKICKLFELEDDYFEDKELENVLMTSNNIVVGEYETNSLAMDKKRYIDSIIYENYAKNTPIIIDLRNKE